MYTGKKRLLAMLFGTLGWGIVAVVPTAAEVPDHLYSIGEEPQLLWVSAEACPNGRRPLVEIPRDVSPEEQNRLALVAESVAASPTEECSYGHYWSPVLPIGFEVGTLAAAVRSALFIGESLIVDRKAGFFNDAPGHLLEVRSERLLKNDPSSNPGRTYLVFYPRGEVRAGTECYVVSDPSFPSLPEIGTRLVFFSMTVPFDAERRLILPYYETVFGEDAVGALVVPPSWSEEVARLELKRLSDLLDYASKIVDEAGPIS